MDTETTGTEPAPTEAPAPGRPGTIDEWVDPCGHPVTMPAGITVFYDADCALCRRCRAWLETQQTWVPISFVATDEEGARQLLPQLPWLGTELVVVGDDGSAWIGPAAFLTCLWATKRYRGWSHRLSGPSFAPMAESFFHRISDNRAWLARRFDDACGDGSCHHRIPPPSGSPPSDWRPPVDWTRPPYGRQAFDDPLRR